MDNIAEERDWKRNTLHVQTGEHFVSQAAMTN